MDPVRSLPEPIPTPVGPIVEECLTSITPTEVSLETLNSQYLQRHSDSAEAILASAKVSYKLTTPKAEVESLVFTALSEGATLDIKVGELLCVP